jgi:hypothetical protein
MACRSGGAGATCTAGCPLTLPDAQHLVLWLVGDAYSTGASIWTDESGHADATCANCPAVGSLNSRGAVSFDGTTYFALGDPGGLYQTTAFTVFLVAAPSTGAASNAVIVGFSDGNGGDALSLQRSGSNPDLLMQLLPGSSTNSIVAAGAWAGAAEAVVATVDASGAVLTVGSTPNSGAIGTPANVDYTSSYLGTDPATQTANFTGQIAEVIVFNTVLSSASIASVRSYITGRYGL